MSIRDCYPTIPKPDRFDPARFQSDEIKLCPPLVAESKEGIVGYIRSGGCTAGCGACCQAFVIPLNSEGRDVDGFLDVHRGRIQVPVDPIVIGKAGTDDWEHWLTLHDTYLFGDVLTADLPVEAEAPSDTMTTEDWYAWLEAHGIAVLQRAGQQVLAYVHRKCDELGEDGLCQLVGTLERPELCSPYPTHPTDIQGLDFCSYNFAVVEQAELMARGLIGQGRLKPQPPKKKGKRKTRGRRR